ncbi:MAG: BrnT family toxin [Acidobacteriia bacterium]|nr:BrnT family toxin [Terriglobia bacterium]
MRFVWDEGKNRRNRAKHKVSFETAKVVFEDALAVSIQDRIVEAEQRWETLGLVGGAVVLLVAHTYEEESGEEIIRIVSARKATPRERMLYEQAH